MQRCYHSQISSYGNDLLLCHVGQVVLGLLEERDTIQCSF